MGGIVMFSQLFIWFRVSHVHFSCIHLLARVFYFRLRPLDAEETCVGNSKGAAAVFVAVVVVVVGNTGNNAAGLRAGHTDTSGRGSESGAVGDVAVAHSRSHKMGRSAKGRKGCAQKPQQKSGNFLFILSLLNVPPKCMLSLPGGREISDTIVLLITKHTFSAYCSVPVAN